MPTFPLKRGGLAVSRPIKAYSHRGFVTGWCAITMIGVTAFWLLALPLAHDGVHIPTMEADVSASPR